MEPNVVGKSAPKSPLKTGAKYVLFVLFMINLLNFYDRQLLGALGEPVRHEFALSDTSLGLLGTIFTIIYAIIGLPLGWLSDQWYRNRLIAIGTTVWSVLTAATGLAQSYTQMFIARLGVGVGEATFAPAGQSLIGDFYPTQERSKAMGIFMLGLPGGVFLAYFSAGWIGGHWGWRAAFLLACVPGLLFALLALRMVEPARGTHDKGRALIQAADAVQSPYLAVLSLPTMRWIILSGIFHNFNMYAINTFNSPFLQRVHHLGLQQASIVSSVAVGAVGAIGLLLGGYFADKLSTTRRNGRLLLSAGCMTAAAPCVFFAISQPAGAIRSYIILMALGTINMYVYYATVYTAIQDVIEPRLRGTAVAVYFCAMYILGASMGPVGTGFLSDHFAKKAMLDAGSSTMTETFKAVGLHHAMYAIPILALIAGLALFAAARTMDKDVLKQESARARL